MIYCKLNFPETLKRIKSRKFINTDYESFDNEFKAFYNMAEENSIKKVKLMEYLNVPVLTIDMSEDITKNAEKALNFIEALI